MKITAIIIIFSLGVIILGIIITLFWNWIQGYVRKPEIIFKNLESWKKEYNLFDGTTMFFHPTDKETYFGYKIHKSTKKEFEESSLKMGVEVPAGECDETRDIVVDRKFFVQNFLAKEYILECKVKNNEFIIRYVAVFNQNKNKYAHFSFTTWKSSFKEMNKKFDEILDKFTWQ